MGFGGKIWPQASEAAYTGGVDWGSAVQAIGRAQCGIATSFGAMKEKTSGRVGRTARVAASAAL